MRVPAIAAITFRAVIAARWATQVQGQGSCAAAFKVAPRKPSNPDSTNRLSALSMISSSSGDAKLDR
jgi:hypothetical protein